MKKEQLLSLFLIYFISFVGNAQTKVTDEIVHEIITECVSKTGGFIIKEETKANNDHETQIALPPEINHYKLVQSLSPLMKEIENYYFSIKPWKVLDNGCLCNFNLAKDNSNRALAFAYFPDNRILIVNDSPNNSPKLSFSTSFIEKLKGMVTWSSVNYLNGFIREENKEDIANDIVKYQIAIQLQDNITPTSIISDFKPISTVLEQMYYLAQPWKQDENGVLECEYFAERKDYNMNMLIHFYYFPKPHVFVIDFIQIDSK